jgi:hypothetical protein
MLSGLAALTGVCDAMAPSLFGGRSVNMVELSNSALPPMKLVFSSTGVGPGGGGSLFRRRQNQIAQITIIRAMTPTTPPAMPAIKPMLLLLLLLLAASVVAEPDDESVPVAAPVFFALFGWAPGRVVAPAVPPLP